jgi:hypothetical protein
MMGELTVKANCPEYVYMPQLYISDLTCSTFSGLSTVLLVMGQTPPLARVAATTLALSQFSSKEQS